MIQRSIAAARGMMISLCLLANPVLAGDAAVRPPASAPAVAAPADPVAPPAEQASVQAYGASHADCLEWTDACIVCTRGDPAPACSTPGIACAPIETICRKSAAK